MSLWDVIPSAWKGHRPFAHWIVNRLKPKMTVDLGVDYGFSTFSFAEPGIGTVVGIDTFEGDEHCGPRNTLDSVLKMRNTLHLDNVVLLRGWFNEINKHWIEPIDILHIDGRHKYEDVKGDYEMWHKFVSPTGVILMHDTNVGPESYSFGVKKFFDEIQLPKHNFLHSYGLGVVSQDEKLIKEIGELAEW